MASVDKRAINFLRKIFPTNLLTQSPYASTELFHFVGRSAPNNQKHNFEILSQIMEVGCISHPPHDGSWSKVEYRDNPNGDLMSESLIIPSITCYADIPINSLYIHMKKYGQFGISFEREFLTKYGARPIIYIPMSNRDWASPYSTTMLKDIEAIYRGYKKHVVRARAPAVYRKSRSLGSEPIDAAEAIETICSMFEKDFLAFIKPFDAHLPENHPNNFYMEREWRKFGNLKFQPSDVSTIIVAFGFKEQLEASFPQYAGKVIEL